MFETTYTVKVLSEEAIPESMEIDDVLTEASDGAYVAHVESQSRVITTEECAKLLLEYGSEPEFFNLNDDGTERED